MLRQWRQMYVLYLVQFLSVECGCFAEVVYGHEALPCLCRCIRPTLTSDRPELRPERVLLVLDTTFFEIRPFGRICSDDEMGV